MEKAKRKVKKSAPLSTWALILLKITQHMAVVITVVATIAFAISSSVYVEDYDRRYTLQCVSDIEESKNAFAMRNMYHHSTQLLRYVTIRSQLEVDGKFDGKKVINVSEYCYRKKDDYTSVKMTYFPDANFLLEDLLKWNRPAALEYLQKEINNTTTLEPTTEVAVRSAGGTVHYNVASEAAYYNVSSSNIKYAFTNVDGIELRYLVSTVSEYKELLRQLIECINEIAYNYNDYQYLNKEYNRSDSNFVYYVDMKNATGDVYTNLYNKFMDFKKMQEVGKETDGLVELYFNSIDYSAKRSSGIWDNYESDFSNYIVGMSEPGEMYTYAFGEDAVVYIGYDLSLGAQDDMKTVWDAYDDLNLRRVYTLLAIAIVAALYYVIVLCYLMYASGRKVDEATLEEYVELTWIDTIPLGLYLVWLACLGTAVTATLILCVEGIANYQYQYLEHWILYAASAGTIFINVLALETLLSLAKRLKSRTLFKNSLFYKYGIALLKRFFKLVAKIYRKFAKRIQYYVEHAGRFESTWGVLLIEIVFTIMSIAVIWRFLTNRNYQVAIIVAVIYALVRFIISYRRMVRKEERMDIVEKIEGIVAGEECRVDEEKLSAENASLGHAVNEIGEGIQNAVQISTRDERLKAELLTNVSHDIKTPLTSIINYVDLLKKETLNNEKANEYLEVLENKSLKLKNLIQDLIEVSKISTGNIEYEMMPLNVHELMLQATGEYEERFAERCLKLVYNNDVTETKILADSRRMWRVLENLFSNAYKYALEGTRIYIEVSQEEDKLHISIKNISAKELSVKAEDLTERFVRGDASRTTEGSGLGLAIAKNLVVGQGGQFHITSDGDLFKVRITFKTHQL